MDLSDADRRILGALQRDSRISNQDLAEHAGLSASACWRRVKALEESGAIAGYPALLNAPALGLEFEAIVHVTLARHDAEQVGEFIDTVSRRPEVLDLFATAGEADYHLRVLCADKDAYNRFLEEVLFRQKGILHVRTNLVLKELKSTRALPL